MIEAKLQFKNEEEFEIYLDALNHGLIAMNIAYACARFGLDTYSVFEEKFKDMDYEELVKYTTEREKVFEKYYFQLLGLEHKYKNADII